MPLQVYEEEFLCAITVFKISLLHLNQNQFNSLNVTACYDIAPCSVVEIYRRYRGACCLHHQDAWHIPEGCHLHALRRENLKTRQFN
jgi:hypothetical protein